MGGLWLRFDFLGFGLFLGLLLTLHLVFLGFLFLLFLLALLAFVFGLNVELFEQGLQLLLLLLFLCLFRLLGFLLSLLGLLDWRLLLLFGFLDDFFCRLFFLLLFLARLVVNLERVLDGVQTELFLLELLSFEAAFDGLDVSELSSELFLGIEGDDVGLLLFDFLLGDLGLNLHLFLRFGLDDSLLLFL